MEIVVSGTHEDRVAALAALLVLYRDRWPERLEVVREAIRRDGAAGQQEASAATTAGS